ncbi:MAG: penicillin-binding transpeptidase domain-containing protein [Bradymonadia bacterium]
MFKLLIACCALSLWASSASAQSRVDCFAVLKTPGDQLILSDEEACNRATMPYSTFKVPLALMAMQAGVVKSIEDEIEWDPKQDPARGWWPDSWRGSQNLRAALHSSSAPYFRTLARSMGLVPIARALKLFRYGNRQLDPTIFPGRVWVKGPLAISPVEQLDFLKRVHTRTLHGVDDAHIEQLEAAWVDTAPGLELFAKSGTGALGDEMVGWYVGYTVHNDETHYFALRLVGPDVKSVTGWHRRSEARRLLVKHSAWPAEVKLDDLSQ